MSNFTEKISVYRKSFFNDKSKRKTITKLFGIALIATIGMLVLGQFSMQTVYAQDSKVVTFYDDGVEKIIVTRGETISDALKDAEINISKNDEVSPKIDEKIVKSYTVVKINRSRNIIVTDGIESVNIVTAAQSNQEIAKAAGMPMLSEDLAEMSLISSDESLARGGAGLELSIKRAKTVEIMLYGQPTTVRTQEDTIAGLLDHLGIKMGNDDTITVSQNAKITDGMKFQIWRNGLQTMQVEEEVPFEKQQIDDNTKSLGYVQVQSVGQNGKKTVIYQVNMRDGQEFSREKISEVITVQPVSQVEIIGTKVVLPPGSHEDWMAMAGISPSDYGYVNYIFTRESGWNPAAMNPSGKYVGLGQTSPASLSKTCPNWRSDPICQIQHFNGYAVSRYGSWSGAYNFWTKNHWW